MEYIVGLDRVVRTINRLKDKTAQKAMRAGLTAGLRELNKAIRAGVNASQASPRLKTAARKAVGVRLMKEASTRATIAAKGGFGVGFHGKRKREKAAVATKQRKADKQAGVGVSASNIHWFVLGTRPRATGARTSRSRGRTYVKSTGHAVHSTGSLPPILAGITKRAAASSGPRIIKAITQKVQYAIAREVHRSQVPKLVR
jgi:hypothetical protein